MDAHTDRSRLPFELTTFLGRGGFGSVWAVERGAAVRAAVKLLHHVSAAVQQRFVLEARAVAQLQHPHIIRIFDFGELSAPLQAGDDVFEAGSSYLMTALGRANLRAFPALSGEDVRRLLLELLSALAHAHARGVIHRDIKPANILASTSAGPPWLLADFGTAHAFDVAAVDDDQRWAGVGTPRYMAPEQIWRELERQGPWTDLFALGCMAQELALGRPLHQGLTLQQILSAQLSTADLPLEGVDPGYRDWLAQMTATHPLDRFRSAADAARALRQVAAVPAQGGARVAPVAAETLTLGAPAPRVRRPAARPDSPPVPLPFAEVPATWQEPTPVRAPIGLGVGVLHVRDVSVLGRGAEQQQLWQALRQAAQTRRPHAVLLWGPVGIGKSRLTRWLAEQAHEELGADTVSISAALLGSGEDASTVLLAALLRCAALSPHQRGPLIRDLLARYPTLAEPTRAAILARLVEGAAQADGPALLCALLAAQAHDRPVVLVVDDAHQSPAAIALAEALVVEGRGAVVVCLAVQDEALAEAPQAVAALAALSGHTAQVTALHLGPLSIEAQQSLLRAKVGLEQHEALGLADRTAGNPRYAEELLQAWLAEGRLELGPEGSRIRDLGREAEALPAFAAAWAARLERALAPLSPAEQHLVERAAVLGMTVDCAEWERACVPAPLPTAALQRLTAALVWRAEDAGRVRFIHAQLREALLDRARRGGRLVAHHWAAVAAVDEADPHAPYRIAHHLIGAGAVDQALESMPAVEAAQPSWHHGEVLLAQIQHAIQAAGAPLSDPRWGAVGASRVQFLMIALRLQEAQALLERLKADAERYGWSPLEQRLLLLQARLARRMYQPDAAIQAHTQLRALYLRQGDIPQVADCEASIGRILLEEGRREAALEMLEQARARVGLVGNKLLESLAIAYTCLERFDDADEVLSRWEEQAEASGEPGRLGYVKLERGSMLVWRGHLDGALALFEAAERLLDESGLTNFALFARINQGIVLARQGHIQRAHLTMTDIINSLPPQMGRTTRSIIHCSRLVTDAALQDWELWQEDLGWLGQLAAVPDPALALVLEDAARWASQHGRPEAAAEVLARAAAVWRDNQYPERAQRAAEALQRLRART